MAPGFFGKVRSHGDFLARRLPSTMQQPFDAWLQAGLRRGQADLGAAWMPAWLKSPLWRFVLAPGLCGELAWTGVMMPSVDRVGRCFPLIIAAGLARAPALPDCLALYAPWYAQLETLALSSLDADFAVAPFDAALLGLDGAPQPVPASVLEGCSAWWTMDAAERRVAICTGMPPPAYYAALIDGRWPACAPDTV